MERRFPGIPVLEFLVALPACLNFKFKFMNRTMVSHSDLSLHSRKITQARASGYFMRSQNVALLKVSEN